MASITDTATDVFRQYETDGVPASGAHKPSKTEIQALFGQIDSAILDASGGLLGFATWAELDAFDTTGLGEAQVAKVYDDSGTHTDPVTAATVDNAGIYALVIGSPGGWQWVTTLEYEALQAAEAAAVASVTNAAGLGGFDTATNGLSAAASGQLFGVEQSYGKGVDLFRDNGGTALFQGLAPGARGAAVQAIKLQQMSAQAATQVPAGWDVWWAMDAALTNWAYIPYRTPQRDLGAYRQLAGTYCMSDLRDESVGSPVITRNALNGPCGALTAATAVYSSTAHVLGIMNIETNDLEAGAAYTIEATMVTTGGVGSKNYRLGQSGTAGVNYKLCAVPDTASTTFTDPTNAASKFTHTFIADNSKQVGIWPDTSGDYATLAHGSIRIVRADSALVPLASQQWGGYVSRGAAAIGGIVLDADRCFTNAGLSDPGLIDFPPTWPTPVSCADGKAEVVLAEFVGGAGVSSYAVLSSEDYNNQLSPPTTNSTFGLSFQNTGREGQFAPQPAYSFALHGANGIGLGLQCWWQSYDEDRQVYGVGGAVLGDRVPSSFTAWSSLAERMGSYNGTADRTQSATSNKMRIAAKARKRSGSASLGEMAQVVRALQEQALIAQMTLGQTIDVTFLIFDSNGVGGTDNWDYVLTANGYMGTGRLNAILSNKAVGGKGLYKDALFNIDTEAGGNGFIDQLDQIRPGIDFALELGCPVSVMVGGPTNDADECNSDVARVISEYDDNLWSPVLATGVDLLTIDGLPCADRFTLEATNLAFRAGQKAFADANTGRAWHHDSGNTELFDVNDAGNHTNFLSPDWVHLSTAGDALYAVAAKTIINRWRDERD
ncbi:MAG: hypothetical protein GC145_06270 [Caulobacter sp.]|nr:hypothetical protein [Caulobacter sp.]